jgi:hypothetical protein
MTIWSFGDDQLDIHVDRTPAQRWPGHLGRRGSFLGRRGSFLGRICDGRGRNGRSDRCGPVMPPITPGTTGAADCLASDRNGTRGAGSCCPAPLRHPAVDVASTPPTSQLHTIASSAPGISVRDHPPNRRQPRPWRLAPARAYSFISTGGIPAQPLITVWPS